MTTCTQDIVQRHSSNVDKVDSRPRHPDICSSSSLYLLPCYVQSQAPSSQIDRSRQHLSSSPGQTQPLARPPRHIARCKITASCMHAQYLMQYTTPQGSCQTVGIEFSAPERRTIAMAFRYQSILPYVEQLSKSKLETPEPSPSEGCDRFTFVLSSLSLG